MKVRAFFSWKGESEHEKRHCNLALSLDVIAKDGNLYFLGNL